MLPPSQTFATSLRGCNRSSILKIIDYCAHPGLSRKPPHLARGWQYMYFSQHLTPQKKPRNFVTHCGKVRCVNPLMDSGCRDRVLINWTSGVVLIGWLSLKPGLDRVNTPTQSLHCDLYTKCCDHMHQLIRIMLSVESPLRSQRVKVSIFFEHPAY